MRVVFAGTPEFARVALECLHAAGFEIPLVLTQPEIIRNLHAAYLDAGADILETNTFNSTAVTLADYGMESLAREINVAGARLARAVADAFEAGAPERPRYDEDPFSAWERVRGTPLRPSGPRPLALAPGP